MATAVCNSANPTAPAKLLGHAEPEAYWDPAAAHARQLKEQKSQSRKDENIVR